MLIASVLSVPTPLLCSQAFWDQLGDVFHRELALSPFWEGEAAHLGQVATALSRLDHREFARLLQLRFGRERPLSLLHEEVTQGLRGTEIPFLVHRTTRIADSSEDDLVALCQEYIASLLQAVRAELRQAANTTDAVEALLTALREEVLEHYTSHRSSVEISFIVVPAREFLSALAESPQALSWLRGQEAIDEQQYEALHTLFNQCIERLAEYVVASLPKRLAKRLDDKDRLELTRDISHCVYGVLLLSDAGAGREAVAERLGLTLSDSHQNATEIMTMARAVALTLARRHMWWYRWIARIP